MTSTSDAATVSESITCPVCGGVNDCDAVFCSYPSCCKALGEFKYVREELAARARWHETMALHATNHIGKAYFLLANLFWVVVWMIVNSGAIAHTRIFDPYPFGLLGVILGIEAILISIFVLISQNRQNAHADKRAELDYEVNVRTYREIRRIDARLDQIEHGESREP